LGSSRHCAPVRRIHNTPFRTARVSCGGLPRPSARCRKRSNGSNTAHSSLLTSPRSRMGNPRSAPEPSFISLIPANTKRKTPSAIYETGTSRAAMGVGVVFDHQFCRTLVRVQPNAYSASLGRVSRLLITRLSSEGSASTITCFSRSTVNS